MAEGKILADKNHNAFSSLKRQLSEFIPNRYILEHFYLKQEQQQKTPQFPGTSACFTKQRQRLGGRRAPKVSSGNSP